MTESHSRFKKKAYLEILGSPYGSNKHPRRGILPLKERNRRITKQWYRSKWIVGLSVVLFFVLTYYLYHLIDIPSKGSPDYIASLYKSSFYGCLLFSVILLFALALMVYRCCFMFKQISSLLSRKAIDDASFFQSVADMPQLNYDYVKSIRDVLGHIYCLDSQIIYTRDSLNHLAIFGNPCYFELILGVSLKLGIELTDCEIDVIGKKMQDEAKTVKDVINVLCGAFNK